jgi:predicted acylesterase/phospholipase RssA
MESLSGSQPGGNRGGSRNWSPQVVVLGPGGIKGFLELGALCACEDKHFLPLVDTYVGVSVGAMISLLKVVGYTMKEIIAIAADTDILQDMTNISMRSSWDNMGILSNEPIRQKLTTLVGNKSAGQIPTLAELYQRTGLSLISVTLNYDDDRVEYMGPTTNPTISCVTAVMLSMNIPFVLHRILYEGKIYVDGALGNPYPVDLFDDGTTDILGFYIKTRQNNSPGSGNMSIWSYMSKTFSAAMDHHRERIIRYASPNCRHICLFTEVNDTIGITVTPEDKAKMIIDGYRAGLTFIQMCNAERAASLDTVVGSINILEQVVRPTSDEQAQPLENTEDPMIQANMEEEFSFNTDTPSPESSTPGSTNSSV